MSCLDESAALEYLKGQLTPDASLRAQRHVAECSTCQDLLALIVQHSFIDGTPAKVPSAASSTDHADAAVDAVTGPLPHALLGQRVGNFVITGFLGKGGMGEVYLATHPQIGRQVAVKVLPAALPELTRRFLNEARILASLRHPNVVEVYDFGELESGQPYCTMELLWGQGLDRLIRERAPMKAAEVRRYAEQICDGLQAGHDAGIVHRDLKPSNIIVLQAEPLRLKLVDFGLAKIVGDTATASQATRPGIVVGTPYFLAPEQAAGEQDRISPQTDVYALGVLLYWMLAGRPPFTGKAASLVAQHISASPPPLDGTADVSPAVARLVECCLAKSPADRPLSMREVRDGLRAALEHVASGSRTTARRRWIWAAVLCFLLLGVALLASRDTQCDAPHPSPVADLPDSSPSPAERRAAPRGSADGAQAIAPRPRAVRRRSAALSRPDSTPRVLPDAGARRPGPDARGKARRIGEGTLPF